RRRPRHRQSGRHALDWPERERLRHPWDRQSPIDRLREIARLHPASQSRCRAALRARSTRRRCRAPRRADAGARGTVRRVALMPHVKVLSFADVSVHGREWRTRFASSALALAMLSAAASAQSQTFVDLAPDLASKIAAALAPATPVRLSFQKEDERVQAELARLLAARGFRVVESGAATIVSGGCLAYLRERVCAAAIGSGDARRVVMTTRLHGDDAALSRDP